MLEEKERKKREKEEKKKKREEENKRKAEEQAKKAEERTKKAEEKAKKAEEKAKSKEQSKPRVRATRQATARVAQEGNQPASTAEAGGATDGVKRRAETSSSESLLKKSKLAQSTEVDSSICCMCLKRMPKISWLALVQTGLLAHVGGGCMKIVQKIVLLMSMVRSVFVPFV